MAKLPTGTFRFTDMKGATIRSVAQGYRHGCRS